MGNAEFWARLPSPDRRMDEANPRSVVPEPPVAAYGRLMRKELHANAHKGDRASWCALAPKVFLAELNWHMIKLGAAMRLGDTDGIAEYCADLGNAAMMIADIYGILGE